MYSWVLSVESSSLNILFVVSFADTKTSSLNEIKAYNGWCSVIMGIYWKEHWLMTVKFIHFKYYATRYPANIIVLKHVSNL